MKPIFTALSLFFGACISAMAYSVSGTATSADGEGEPYATIRVYNSTDTVAAAAIGAADDQGKFKLPLKSAGDYTLRVSAVGKVTASRDFTLSAASPNADLGRIDLADATNVLGEVTVTAQRPLVVKEIDRIGYDVQADEDSKTSSLRDILQKVPLVTVDDDGTIRVKGGTDFKIYRNGRPSQGFTQNAKELFQGLPASSIKKIEVITDPGAREDAEGVGAILNIVTNDVASMSGVTGSVNLYGDTRENMIPSNPSLNLTAQVGKFTISPYAGMWHSSKGNRRTQSNHFTYSATGDEIASQVTTNGNYTGTWAGFDASFELDTLNLFTAELMLNGFRGREYDNRQTWMTAADGSPIYSFHALTTNPHNHYFGVSGAVNYQRSTRRKGETLTLSYRFDLDRQRSAEIIDYSDLVNPPFSYTGINSDSKPQSSENTVQIDWSRPYGSIHKLDIGAKYINRQASAKSYFDYIGAMTTTDDFRHTTHVGAGYADYRAAVGRWSVRGGLRYEWTRFKADYPDGSEPGYTSSLSDWVPNAAISYNLAEGQTLKASYGMRINRPGINTLDPAINATPTSQSSGNPNLESSRYNQFNLNYSITKQRFNLDFSAGYDFTDNGIIDIQYTRDNILYTTYGNVGRTRTASLSLFTQWSITDKTSLMVNAAAYYKYFANPDALPGITLKNYGWQGNAFMRLSQALPWKLRASLNLMYWGGYLGSVYSTMRPTDGSALNHSLSLQRSFLKEDRLTVTLMARNPFGPYHTHFRQESLNNGTIGEANISMHRRASFGISIGYRFGSLRAQVKRTKGITNDDLQGGASGGGQNNGQGSQENPQ